MLTDALTNFVAPNSGGVSLVAGVGVNFPVGNVYDIAGVGVGQAPTAWFGQAVASGALFGADMGIPDGRPEFYVAIGTAAAGAGAQLNLQFQLAPDTGSAGNYQPGTWQTVAETGYLTVAQLTAGQTIMRFPWLPAFPANLNPRFARLYALISAAAAFTAGTIAVATLTQGRDDLAIKYQRKNYTV